MFTTKKDNQITLGIRFSFLIFMIMNLQMTLNSQPLKTQLREKL